jgi:HEAT repeat protein
MKSLSIKTLCRILGATLVAGAAGVGIATALDAPLGDPDVVELLGGMNYVPDQSSLDAVLGATAVAELVAIAEDDSQSSDPGLRMRALRALAQYDGSPDEVVASAALRRAITTFGPADTGTELLFLRASMLSLATLDGPAAVPDLVGLLPHLSRDIRAACAQALGITGSDAAIVPLRNQDLSEVVPQVKIAIADALFQLDSSD